MILVLVSSLPIVTLSAVIPEHVKPNPVSKLATGNVLLLAETSVLPLSYVKVTGSTMDEANLFRDSLDGRDFKHVDTSRSSEVFIDRPFSVTDQ